jgi:hypothetical protein
MASRNGRTRRNGSSEKRGIFATVAGMVSSGLAAVLEATEPDDSLDAIDLLRAQHRYVEKLFSQIESARGSSNKRAAFRELADILAIHATIEERIFYPAVKSRATTELLAESAEEHLAMKRSIADILENDVAGDEFDAKLSVLQEQVHHHAVEEEERKLFLIVRKETDADFRAGLASEMIGLMVELEDKGSPRDAIPDETDRAVHV